MVDKIQRLLNVHDADKAEDPLKLGFESLVFQEWIQDWVSWSIRFSIGEQVVFTDTRTKGGISSVHISGTVQSFGEHWEFNADSEKRKLIKITSWVVLTGVHNDPPPIRQQAI